MNNIRIHQFGQLIDGDVTFGDLTILVGPQASAKSIFLQLVKLTLDNQQISRTIRQHGFDWQNDPRNFLSLYFGEGMQNLWSKATEIEVDGAPFVLDKVISMRGKKKQGEKLFLIPAQRVIALRNGWPRAFTDYEAGDPYVVKQFSEQLRLLMEAGLGGGKSAIFPQEGRFNKDLRQSINASIFSNAEVRLDTSGMRKRIVLNVGSVDLPYMVWSAGQREFIPLLIGLYALMPSSRAAKKPDIDWVVIEEPEMGLHPQAVSSLLLIVLELLHRGYKIIVSTHSSQLLELVWAIQTLADLKTSPEKMLKLFDLRKTAYLQELFQKVLTKSFKTYLFDRQQGEVHVKDISSLDPNDADDLIADWGGLTEFSTLISSLVSEAVRETMGE